jgi:hypothetical protein
VWATGRAPQSILHFDGKAWTVAANVSAADLGAVWAASQRDVWVATGRSQFPSDGQAGPALLHWDGETWHRAFESPARLFALAAAGPDDLWAVGEGGSAFHYDGYAWQAHHLPSKNLISAWAAGTGEVWASGCGDGMFRWNGHGWGQLTVPVSKNHLGVCLKLAGASRRRGTVELWGAGLTSILRSDGGSWSYAPNPIRIGALHGGEPAVPKLAYNARVNAATFAGAELWAVGEDYLDTLILHWDGARWTRTTLPGIREGLRAVWGSRADDVWAVGDHGLVLHFDGVTWSRLDAPAIKRLDGVAGADDRVWVTGAEGTLLRWDPER